jgi:hypothetical protein
LKHHGFRGHSFPLHTKRAFKSLEEHFPVHTLNIKVQGQLEEQQKVLLSEYKQSSAKDIDVDLLFLFTR